MTSDNNNNLNTNRPITRSSAFQASTIETYDEQILSSDANDTLHRSVLTGGEDSSSSVPMDVQKLATEFEDDADVSTILLNTEQSVSPVVDTMSSTTGHTDYSVPTSNNFIPNGIDSSLRNKDSSFKKDSDSLMLKLRNGSERELMTFVEREFRNHQHVYNMSMQTDKDINKFIPYLMKWRSIMRDHPSYGNSRRMDDLFSEVGEELTAMKKTVIRTETKSKRVSCETRV